MGVAPERTVIIPGHVVKNRNCPGKFGTDSHLIISIRLYKLKYNVICSKNIRHCIRYIAQKRNRLH